MTIIHLILRLLISIIISKKLICNISIVLYRWLLFANIPVISVRSRSGSAVQIVLIKTLTCSSSCIKHYIMHIWSSCRSFLVGLRLVFILISKVWIIIILIDQFVVIVFWKLINCPWLILVPTISIGWRLRGCLGLCLLGCIMLVISFKWSVSRFPSVIWSISIRSLIFLLLFFLHIVELIHLLIDHLLINHFLLIHTLQSIKSLIWFCVLALKFPQFWKFTVRSLILGILLLLSLFLGLLFRFWPSYNCTRSGYNFIRVNVMGLNTDITMYSLVFQIWIWLVSFFLGVYVHITCLWGTLVATCHCHMLFFSSWWEYTILTFIAFLYLIKLAIWILLLVQIILI